MKKLEALITIIPYIVSFGVAVFLMLYILNVVMNIDITYYIR